MAKGRFSHSRRDGEENVVQRFSRALQEDETVLLPTPTANPLEDHEDSPRQEEDSSMPECDFDNLDSLDTLQRLDFPELSALDFEKDAPEYSTLLKPMTEKHTPTEEEAIEKAFQQAVEKEVRKNASRKKARGHQGPWLKKLLILLSSLLGLMVLVLGSLTLYKHFSDPYDHLILNGVHVAGVNISSMTRDQAVEAVEAAASAKLSYQDMEVVLPDQTLKLSPAATKISLNVEDAVKAAYSYGRTGSKKEQEEAYRSSLTEVYTVDLTPFLRADEKYILGQLKGYADSHDSTFLPSSYALEGEQPPLDFENYNEKNTPQTLLLTLGNPGFHLDAKAALREIMAAYAAFNMAPRLELQQGDQIPEALDLNEIYKEYYVEPVNSSMDMETFDVISGSYGLTFDLPEAKKLLEKAQYGETVRISMEYVEPDIMDDGVYFQDVLGFAETPHGTGKQSEKRNINLSLACKALDGMILYPGDEFSYNEALGQRTADKGYQAAPAYSGDTLVNSLGGGICQVSSTLYYSCLLADLQITDRINHGFLPSYIAPGMDATVSWGKPDFKFKNNTDFPIKIHAESTEDKVKVEILGTDNRDYYVKMDYEMSDVMPNEIYEEHGPDSGYTDGQVIKAGTIGHIVKTFRCKYSKKTDVLISKDLEARSSYMTRPKVIAVVKQEKPAEPVVPPDSGETPEQPETDGGEGGTPAPPVPGPDPEGGDSGTGTPEGGGTEGGEPSTPPAPPETPPDLDAES